MNVPNNNNHYASQNDLLLTKLMLFYEKSNNIDNMLKLISNNNEGKISLRILDWFTTNYAKKHFTVYDVNGTRFKVHSDYRLKLKAYSKRRFDPFCRWERILIPYNDKTSFIETTIAQLNFFKWVIENQIIEYIEEHYQEILNDMNINNSSAKRKIYADNKTRKKREELSISAIKSIKKEEVNVVVKFA
jgi:hypothetical protein